MRRSIVICVHHYSLCAMAALGVACLVGCSSNGQPLTTGTGGSSSGGSSAAGGSGGSGGTTSSGGATSSGGTTAGSGGRITGTGGSSATGGRSSATGGSTTVDGGNPSGGTTQPGVGGTNTRATGGAAPGSGGARSGGTSGGVGGASAGGTTGASTGLAGPAVPSDGCGKATTAKTGKDQTITVSGSSRTYNLKLPANYDQSHPYRLIIAYHWLGGTAANVSDGGGVIKPWYDLDTAAASNGTTVFVAPQGISNGWSNSGGSDVEFSRQLITQLESSICIDKARIFCEGFSMGGSMSYAMASAMPDVIRAVAVHSGGSMSGTTAGHSKPVAYFMTHGTKDSVCTWPGFGLPQLQDFAKVNKCTTPDPSVSASAFQALLPQPTSTAGVCLEFTGCTAGYPTRSCLFVGDHTPSPDGTDGWVPKETWKFFSQF